jgi:hypothetical protein
MKVRMCLQTVVYALAFTLGIIVATQAIKEGFAATSPGTMLQLQTSHVPIEEDEEEQKRTMLINQGLIQMTGSGL